MTQNIEANLAEMEKRLSLYVDKGRVATSLDAKEEQLLAIQPDLSKMTSLHKVSTYEGKFLAVDCSTRTLKRAHNWGIYLMRVGYAIVKRRSVTWGYAEEICTEVGDTHTRANILTHRRQNLESEMALKLLYAEDEGTASNPLRTLDEGDYILLDGASFFGEKTGFWISLYEECFRRNINLLCVSKQSSVLHDEKGRDFIASVYNSSAYPIWVYYPVAKADTDKHRYGDISIIKLCPDSPRAFRCDILDFLSGRQIDDLLSPLTSISEDPRCLGYPVPLWLAHDFTAPSDSNLLYYLDQISKRLTTAGIVNILRSEELSCNFADEIHNVRYPFKREMVGDYV